MFQIKSNHVYILKQGHVIVIFLLSSHLFLLPVNIQTTTFSIACDTESVRIVTLNREGRGVV